MPAAKTAHKIGPQAAASVIQWAVPILWIGAAIFFGFAPWVALVGLGTVILLVQLAEKLAGLEFSRMWNAAAAIFLGAGFLVLLTARVEIFWSAMLFGMFSLLILLAGTALVCFLIENALHWIRRRGDDHDTPASSDPMSH